MNALEKVYCTQMALLAGPTSREVCEVGAAESCQPLTGRSGIIFNNDTEWIFRITFLCR